MTLSDNMDPMSTQRNFVVSAAGYKTRTELFEGREHLVVPVVALVECVMFASNAPAPELVTAEEFSRAPGGWNGRPLFHGHPMKNGSPVSGNLPDVLEKKKIGLVFNAGIKKKKLVMEAWLDVALCAERAPELLARLNAGETVEISVGVFVSKAEGTGTFAGKKYDGIWEDIVPDHLALLPEGDEGACSVEAGCGVRAAKGPDVKIDKTLFSRIMKAFRSAQPATEMTSNDLFSKLVEELREVEPTFDWLVCTIPAQNPNRVVYQVYVPGVAPGYVSDYTMFERAFTLADNGEVTVGDARVEVEPVTYYEPVLMNEEVEAAAGKRNSSKDQKTIQAMHDHATALGATCSPTAAVAAVVVEEIVAAVVAAPEVINNQETENMKLEDIVTFLGSATECDKKALRSALGVETPAPVALETPKAPTFAELLASADESTRAAINEGVRVAGEKKAATIKALKDSGRNSFSDEALSAFDQVSLDNLAKLAGVRSATDFSLQGAPRVAKDETVPAAPDLMAAVRDARK